MSTVPTSGTRARLRNAIAELRLRLARADALIALALLSVVAGLLAGLVIVAFRLITERAPVWAGLLPAIERFEALGWEWRLGLPAAGGLLVGLLFQVVPLAARPVGPVHVMTQLARHGGRLPWRNAVMQFLGGAASIASGHSVGREGPVIHLGAASASLLGQWLRLPNNSIRTLVAGGVAASIAASFNTPVAGVVFAMEVVMYEYTLAGFAPVILAAVSAATVSRIVFGADAALVVPGFQLASLLEMPWVILLGAVVGCLAAAYVFGIVQTDRRTRRLPVWLRMTLAGCLTGLCALVAPEVMGLGYDTVQSAMLGQIGLTALIVIAIAKLLATVACGGLGLPGGMIGPMVVIGACAGGALGVVGQALVPGASAAPAFYAMLGAVAMMGACLQAPLAALMTILELTGNPNMILPGMAAVISAFLIARVVFRQEPLFVSILHARGIDYRVDPVALALERTGVAAVMSRHFVVLDAGAQSAPIAPGAPDERGQTTARSLAQLLENAPDWVIVTAGREIRAIWATDRLAARIAAARPGPDGVTVLPDDAAPFAAVLLHATLGEALADLDRAGADIAVVSAATHPQRHQLQGVISRARIESAVRYRQ